MSQVLGYLILAGIVAMLCTKIAGNIRDVYFQRRILAVERIAVEEYRRNRPIDHVALIASIVGAQEPRIAHAVPANPTLLEANARLIGSVHIAELHSPCDEVVSLSRFYMHRDLGDESDAKEDASTEGSNDLNRADAMADAVGSDLGWASPSASLKGVAA